MPPTPKHDVALIIFDLSTNNLSKAEQFLLKILANKHYSGPARDITVLYFCNAKYPKNELNLYNANQYLGIREASENCTHVSAEKIIELIKETKKGASNWFEALEVALDVLQTKFKHLNGICATQIIFISDFKNPIEKAIANDRILKFTEEMNGSNIYLYMIGPDIDLKTYIRNPDDIRQWMQKEIDHFQDVCPMNLNLMKTIIKSVPNSVICSYELGIQLIDSFKTFGGTQPWNVPLTFGTELEIPTQTVLITRKSDYGHLSSITETLSSSTPKWVLAEELTQEVEPENVVNGVCIHYNFIKIDPAVEKMFKGSDTRSFQVLLITPSNCVPEYLMGSESTHCVLPLNEIAKPAFYTLVDTLYAQKKYIIARKVYSNGMVPKFVVLVPSEPKFVPKCFIVSELPYADDIRREYIETNDENSTKTTEDSIIQFLEQMDINNQAEFLPKCCLLAPQMMRDPNIEGVINTAAKNDAKLDLDLDALNPNYYMSPLKNPKEELKTAWPKYDPTTETDSSDDGKWSDFDEEENFDNDEFVFS